MATTLTFTSTSFYQGTTMSATASFDILGGTYSYDKRIYGISATSTDTAAKELTLWLSGPMADYQVARIAVPINAGNTNLIAQVDIFGDSKFAATFQKQADANGKPYFNLPAGYTILANLTAATTATKVVTVHAFGENYN